MNVSQFRKQDVTDLGDALIDACGRGVIGRVKTLLKKHNVNVNYQDWNERTPLNIASLKGREDIVTLLLDYGASIDQQDGEFGWTALHHACSEGHGNVVALLHDRGASVEQQDYNGWTPVHIASREGDTKMIMLLLTYGARVDQQSNEGWTPLHEACYWGHQNVVTLLLDHGASFDQQDENGWTPLHHASYGGHRNVVNLLYDLGVCINQKSFEGRTPLYLASCQAHKEVVSLLLSLNANPTLKDKNGKTAKDIAQERGHTDIVNLLSKEIKPRKNQRNQKLNSRQVASPKFGEAGTLSLLVSFFSFYAVHPFQPFIWFFSSLFLLAYSSSNLFSSVLSAIPASFFVSCNNGETAKDINEKCCRSDVMNLTSKKVSKAPKDLRNPFRTQDNVQQRIQQSTAQDNDRRKQVEMLKQVEIMKRRIDILEARGKMRMAMNSSQSSDAVIPYAYVEDCTKHFTAVLGKGGFGNVFFAEDEEEKSIQYTVKKVSYGSVNSCQGEIEALRRLVHPNIVRIYGTSNMDNDNMRDVYLLHEYISGSDLSTFLSSEKRRKNLSSLTRVNILCQVAQAMHFLHSGGAVDGEKKKYIIFHQDIKPDNIYLDDKLNVKLSDCGFAKFKCAKRIERSRCTIGKAILETTTSIRSAGSNRYVCPQYKECKVEFEGRCDVYSFGVVMMEILTGSLEDNLLLDYNMSEKLRKNFDKSAGSDWNCVKEQLSDLCLSCIRYKLDDRPTAIELIHKLTYIQRMMRNINMVSFVSSSPDMPEKSTRSCQICNNRCDDRNIIVCGNGHVVDNCCFCNRSLSTISDFFKCPICSSGITDDLLTLATKVPTEYLMLQNLKTHTKHKSCVQKNKSRPSDSR